MKQDTIVSFYKFVSITDPEQLRQLWLNECRRIGTFGTLLIATEGVNGMISGTESQIKDMRCMLTQDSRFRDMDFKVSHYPGVSFRRMLVKVKKEIITMGQQVDPRKETGKYLDPVEFKQWQDEQKDMLILDTRNDYEVDMGTFNNAVDPKIASFSEFPSWVDQNLADIPRDKTIVTFCTGGIRCEKATAYMLAKGLKNVYQIDGGILRYFEKTQDLPGDNHWQGECTVFDKRLAVTKKMQASEKTICYVCLLEIKEKDTKYQWPAGLACASCSNKMKQNHEERVAKGLDKHRQNLKNRAEYLQSQRQLFAKRHAMRNS